MARKNVQKYRFIATMLVATMLAGCFLCAAPHASAYSTLGYTTAINDAYNGGVSSGNVWLFGPYTAAATGKILNIYAYANTSTGVTVKCAWYSDNGGVPFTLLDQSEVLTVYPGAKVWLSFSGFASYGVTAGQKYWFAFITNASSGAPFQIGNVAGGSAKAHYQAASYPTFPSSISGSLEWSSAMTLSVYANVLSDPFTVGNISASAVLGSYTRFNAQWSTNATLDKYVFGSNQSGSWVNNSAVSFTSTWSNTTGAALSSFDSGLIGGVIQWRVWANLTTGQTLDTGLQNVTVTANYMYTFKGVYSETSGVLLPAGSANITIYFATTGESYYNFVMVSTDNSTVVYAPAVPPLYFHFNITDGVGSIIREYWVAPSESGSTIYVFYGDDTVSYIVNFLDYTGVLQRYPYIEAKANVNGSMFTVEKRKVDTQNSVIMELINGRKYSLSLGDGSTSYVYGDVLMTSVSAVQLTLRGIDFPQTSLLMYKYVRIYGLRDFDSPSGITVYYEDDLEATTSVTLSFCYRNGTVAHSAVQTGDSFAYTWAGADNSTDYFVNAEIVHETYGEVEWNQVFVGKNSASSPFSFSWMGSLPFDTAVILPILLIFFAAGCFSVLNAEVGAISAVVMALVFSWMGWVPIEGGVIVATLFLAVLMALIYNKRRVQIY